MSKIDDKIITPELKDKIETLVRDSLIPGRRARSKDGEIISNQRITQCVEKGYFTREDIEGKTPDQISALTSDNAIKGYENKYFTFAELAPMQKGLGANRLRMLTSDAAISGYENKDFTFKDLQNISSSPKLSLALLSNKEIDDIVNKTIAESEGDTFVLSTLVDKLKASGLSGEHVLQGVELDFSKFIKFKKIDCSGVDFTRCRLIGVSPLEEINFSNSNLTEATIIFRHFPLKNLVNNFKGANLKRCFFLQEADIYISPESFVESISSQNIEDIDKFKENTRDVVIQVRGDFFYLIDGELRKMTKPDIVISQDTLMGTNPTNRKILQNAQHCYSYGKELQRVIGKGVENGKTTKKCCQDFLSKLNKKTYSQSLYLEEYGEDYIANFATRIDANQKDRSGINWKMMDINDVLKGQFLEKANNLLRPDDAIDQSKDINHITFGFCIGNSGLLPHVIEVVKLEKNESSGENEYFVYDSNGRAVFAKNEYECNLATNSLFRINQDKGYSAYLMVMDREKDYKDRGLSYEGPNKVPKSARNDGYRTKSEIRRGINFKPPETQDAKAPSRGGGR